MQSVSCPPFRRIALCCLLGLMGAWVSASGAQTSAPTSRAAPKPQPRLGINLAGPADWNSEQPFVDVFRMSRPWVSQRKGQPWGKGPALEIDDRGWVKALEKDCFAETLLCTVRGGHYPGGEYTVLYEGEGTIELPGAAVTSSSQGKIVARVDPNRGSILLRITRVGGDKYVRNIRVLMPGFAEKAAADPWHPAFLERWRGVAALRFMDFMHTNGSSIARWADRPTTQHATYSAKGVALELMIDLTNRLGADPWFCMPHLADDDFIRQFAKMTKERLDPNRRVYVEYSNEVWNGMFEQSRWAGEQGVKLGLAPKERPWEGAWRFTAKRSVEIFRIWEEVFGGRDRLVRVLPTQGASPFVTKTILEHQGAGKQADALAVAPYLGMSVPAEARAGGLEANKVETWTVGQVLDHLEKKVLPRVDEDLRRQKALADAYGLRLVAYEGGQHMVGLGPAKDSQKLNSLFFAANAHPRLGDLYAKYLQAWTEAGGDLFCHFSSVGVWSKHGSWGAMQFYDDDPAQSPKYKTIIQWAKAHGQPVKVP